MILYVTSNGIGNAWVANELSRLDASGIPYELHALRAPESIMHGSDWATRLHRSTREIYPVGVATLILSVLGAPLRFRWRFMQALWNALTGERENMRVRVLGIWHLLVATVWATRLKPRAASISHIHSQWINSCGTVAMYGAWLLDVSFSFTGHAADLFRERCALRDKIKRAEFIVCISEFHRRFFLSEGARPEQLFVAYCGIEPEWFYPRAAETEPPASPLRILASGRLVEKKGFSDLIDACAILERRQFDFLCTIGGSGELESSLRQQIDRLGLAHRVTVTGQALKQEHIVEFMHTGHVYALPCVWASDNDVDGLPQMLMEAMASGLPAVSTDLVGIPDLIEHGKTGLLVPAGDTESLANALQALADPQLRQRLAMAGRDAVLSRFNLANCLEPLLERYRSKLQ
jgi:colanic acid/amylovoran biosynthesis glycosyltransferase